MTGSKRNPPEPQPVPIDLTQWKRFTPRQILSLAGRLSLGSWLLCLAVIGGLSIGAFLLGQAYSAGVLPKFAYALHGEGPTPQEKKDELDRQASFKTLYSKFVNWQTLRALAGSISAHQPDGLDTPIEIAVSVLSQVRSSGGTATFLSGESQLTMTAAITEEEMSFEWDEKPSIIPRIFNDAGYPPNAEDIRKANANLNRNGFAYLDSAMEHAVIYRGPDGSLHMNLPP